MSSNKRKQKGQVLSNCANTAVSSGAYSVLRTALSLSACCQCRLHFQRIVSYFYTPRLLSCLTSRCALFLHSSLSLLSQLFRPLRVSLAHLLQRHACSVWLGLSCQLVVAWSVMPAQCGLVCHVSSVWLGLSCLLGVAWSVMPAQCGRVCHVSSV